MSTDWGEREAIAQQEEPHEKNAKQKRKGPPCSPINTVKAIFDHRNSARNMIVESVKRPPSRGTSFPPSV